MPAMVSVTSCSVGLPHEWFALEFPVDGSRVRCGCSCWLHQDSLSWCTCSTGAFQSFAK
jgi:hypothetical protein